MALRLALHSTLAKLGYVPACHQTDNSSAATRRLQAGEQAQAERERDLYRRLSATVERTTGWRRA